MRFVITSLIFALPVLCFAQSSAFDPVVTSGPDLDLPSRSLPGFIVGTDEEGTILKVDKYELMAKSIKPSLMKLDDDLKPLLLRNLVSEYEGKNMFLKRIETFNDELYVFSSFYNARTKKNFLFVRRYDKKTLEPAGELLPISTLTDQSSDSEDSWIILVRKDEKKLAVISRVYGNRKRDPGSVTVQFFDADITETSRYSLTLPGTEERIALGAKALSSDGKVFIVVNDEGEFNARKGRMPSSSLYSIAPGATDHQKIPLDLDGNFTYEHHLDVHEDNTVSVSGIYNKEIDEDGIGIFHLTVSTAPVQIKNTTFIPVISPEGRVGFKIHEGEEINKDNSPETINSFRVEEVLKSSDGSFFLVGSHPTLVSRTYSSGNTFRTITEYFEDNISVIRLQADGTLGWLRTVPRYQTHPDLLSGVLGQTVGLFNDNLYVYFNDETDNIGQFTRPAVGLNARNGCVTRLVRIDLAGNLEDSVLLDNRERKTWSMIPKTYFDEKRGELLTFVYSKSDISVQRIKL